MMSMLNPAVGPPRSAAIDAAKEGEDEDDEAAAKLVRPESVDFLC
ncbi:hypothetical protein PF003_g6748 [Phytophthora fragariae]|nr:hypothetical protein PF003_g6748 [Phytophthora fragariae]